MSSEDFEQAADVSEYGAQRRAAWLAGLQANADMATSAAMQAHAGSNERRITQQGQQGLFGHMTPEARGEAVAAREAVTGSDYGGTPLERLGGLIDWRAVSDSPAPALVDRRFIDRPGMRATGKSPLQRWAEGSR